MTSLEIRRPPSSHTLLICVALFLSLVAHLAMLAVVERLPLRNIALNVDDAKKRLAEAREKFPAVQADRYTSEARPVDRPETTLESALAVQPADTAREAMLEWINAAVPMPELPPSAPVEPAPAPTAGPALPEAAVLPEATPAFARQEIAQILNRQINESLSATPRRELREIPRVAHAPLDFAPPDFRLSASDLRLPTSDVHPPVSSPSLTVYFTTFTPSPELAQNPSVQTTPAEPAPTAPFITAPLTNIEPPQNFTPLDDRLSAGIQTFPAPDGHLYFRVALKPRAPDVLPVQPRDILFVQDCSTSISDARLQFCKRALNDALDTLSPRDRFNIMAFNNNATTAFPSWQANEPATLEQARKFIHGMRSAGGTDFFAALQKTLDFPRDAARPVIVLLITDGQPTAGMTGATPIIGEFTKNNAGQVSLYAFGTHGVANAYLLDLLTHSNRGAMRIAGGTRWDLPQTVAPFIAELSSPLMHAMTANFTAQSGSEVYPSQLPNLFADGTLDLHGRCPPGTTEVVMQLRGAAGESAYDAVFRLPLDGAEPGPPELRERWAQLKVYDLIARYAREPSPEIFEAIKIVSDEYGVPMFYENKIKP